MPLPDNFSHAKHLNNVIRRLHNKRVKRTFRDLGENDWVANLDTPRAEERVACTIQDDDSTVLLVARLLLFYFVLGNTRGLLDVFYAIPIQTFHETVVFQPQVVLHFRETTEDAKIHNRYPLRAQVGFRLRDNNVTRTELERIALEIRNVFATPPLVFKKGRTKFSYLDKVNGYQLIITGDLESDVKDLITKTLQLQNDTPDWENLTDSESGRNWSANQTKTILGNLTQLPKRRQVGNVRFTHAEYKQWGLTRDVVLCDTTGRYPGALEVVRPSVTSSNG